MKAFFGVVLITFVIQASAQGDPSLRCYECTDCQWINATTPIVECYAPASSPTRATNPATISLTPTATTNPPLSSTTPGTTAATTGAPAVADGFVDVSTARRERIFTCFTIQSEIGPRRVVSRGCGIIRPSWEQTCAAHNENVQPAVCELCENNLCNDRNGVTKIFASVSLIFAALFIALRLH